MSFALFLGRNLPSEISLKSLGVGGPYVREHTRGRGELTPDLSHLVKILSVISSVRVLTQYFSDLPSSLPHRKFCPESCVFEMTMTEWNVGDWSFEVMVLVRLLEPLLGINTEGQRIVTMFGQTFSTVVTPPTVSVHTKGSQEPHERGVIDILRCTTVLMSGTSQSCRVLDSDCLRRFIVRFNVRSMGGRSSWSKDQRYYPIVDGIFNTS